MASPPYGEPEYLCFEVIKQVQERLERDNPLPKTTFNKLCYIADKELQNQENIDVGLPSYWYMYGGVKTQDFAKSIYTTKSARWENHRGENVVLKVDLSRSDFDIDDGRANKIQEKVGELVSRFAGVYSVKVSQDYQYENYAPNEFVKVFHKFRSFLDDTELEDTRKAEEYTDVEANFKDIVTQSPEPLAENTAPADDANEQIREYLDQLLIEYPEETYSRMEEEFLEWENLTWEMAKNGFYTKLQIFMEEFWKTFSRVELRINHNQHIPIDLRNHWGTSIGDEIAQFKNEIERNREFVISERKNTSVLDEVAEEYSETVREMFDEPISEK